MLTQSEKSYINQAVSDNYQNNFLAAYAAFQDYQDDWFADWNKTDEIGEYLRDTKTDKPVKVYIFEPSQLDGKPTPKQLVGEYQSLDFLPMMNPVLKKDKRPQYLGVTFNKEKLPMYTIPTNFLSVVIWEGFTVDGKPKFEQFYMDDEPHECIYKTMQHAIDCNLPAPKLFNSSECENDKLYTFYSVYTNSLEPEKLVEAVTHIA